MRRTINITLLCAVTFITNAQGGSRLTTDAVRVQRQRHDFVADSARPLATLPPAVTPWYHTNRAPAVGNGRLYIQQVFTQSPQPVINWPGPGPERFGAENNDGSVVHARAGRAVLSFSPWINYKFVDAGRIDLRRPLPGSWHRRPARVTLGSSSPTVKRAINDIRHARNVWLREHGYVGGVRTFKNPMRNRAEQSKAMPEPAGWFRKPAEMPRTRSTEQVRLSLPPGMNPVAAKRLRELHAEGIETAVASRDH